MKFTGQLHGSVTKPPAQAKHNLASIVEGIVLTPGPDGYTAKLTVRNGTGDPEGGLFVEGSCGGPMADEPATANPSFFVEIRRRA